MTPIVCPLCPLHCDDVYANEQGRLIGGDCSILDGFPALDELPADRGEMTSGDQASKPLRVITTGVDLNLARLLSLWQQAGRVDLTIESDPSLEALLQVTSRDGMVSATLADVASQADVVWLVGEVENAWPRTAEKLRLNCDSKTIVRKVRQWSADELTELAAATEHPGANNEMIDQWSAGTYVAILLGPNAFAAGEEVLCATMLARLVRGRNAEARCVLLTLDAAATLRSVCLWNTNESPRSELACDDHTAFDIRIGSPLGNDSPAANLQIGGLDPGSPLASVYRSCSIAGLHHAGMVIRGDGSVSLPLVAVRKSQLPRAGDLI